MSKNCDKVKLLKKQSEFIRRKRIQRWMNELRKMIEDDRAVANLSKNIKLDKIDLLEYAIKELQIFNNSFRKGYENCQAEIVICLGERTAGLETKPSDLSIIMNKLNEERCSNVKVFHDFNSVAGDGGQKRDVLVKLRQKIIENKRKKCIKHKMNVYSVGGAVDDEVWRPW